MGLGSFIKDHWKTAAKFAVNPLLAVPDEIKAGKQIVDWAGHETGLKSEPSDLEKQNLAEQRDFKNNMLAALQSRLANPLQAPQLGAPAWMGYQTPLGPGTVAGGSGFAPTTPSGGSAGPASRAPVLSGFGTPAVAAMPVEQQNNPMETELERIRRQRMLTALGGNQGLTLG